MIKKIVLFFMILITIILLFVSCIYSTFYGNKNVTIDNKKQYILFYKDNCSDCKKIKYKILKADLRSDTVVVNLNSKKNRKYIAQYGLSSVPTLIKVDKKGKYKLYETNVINIKNSLNKINFE